MSFIDDIKIRQKLFGGFLVVVLILVIVAAIGYSNLGAQNAADTALYQDRTVGQLGTVNADLQFLQDKFYLYALDPELRPSLGPQIAEMREKIKNKMDAYNSSSLTAEEQTQFTQFNSNYMAFNTAFDERIVAAVAANASDQRNITAALMPGSQLLTSQTATVASLQGLQNINANKVYRDLNSKLLISTVIGVVIVIAIALFLINSITVPLDLAKRNLQEMSNGHLSNRLKLNRKDEIGELAAVIDQFSEDLQNQVIGTLMRIADGDTSAIVKSKDAQDEIGLALQSISTSLYTLATDMNSLSKDTIEGKLHTRGDSSKHKGDYKKIVEAVNRALDAVIGPLNVATESVDRISKGDIPKKITDKYNGDFNKTKNNLNMCINNINALSADTNLLAKAALEGNLSTRADATKHKGDYRKIIEDLNKMLDAIVGSLNITVKYIDRISNREIPPKITDKYNGDFNVSKDCINKLIDTCLQEKAKVNDKMVTQANPTAPIGDTPTEPQWQNLEPKEINDPTPHSLKFLSDYNNYLGIGASIRGKYHAHNGLYREDSFKFGHSNGWIIVAVADGAGSAKLSRVGSTLACKILVEYLELHLERCDIVASDDGLQPSEAFLTDIRSILVDAVTASQKKLIEESSARKIETKELASTLLVAIHKKWKDWHFIAGLQIGDGSIVFWDGKDTVRKLGNADSGQYASETVFITSKGNDQNLVNRVFFFLWKDIKSIALMTDGVADDFFPEEKMMPEMFRAIQDKFADTKQGLDTSLLDWLGYERRGSFDDRTIAIINNKS